MNNSTGLVDHEGKYKRIVYCFYQYVTICKVSLQLNKDLSCLFGFLNVPFLTENRFLNRIVAFYDIEHRNLKKFLHIYLKLMRVLHR